MNAAQHILILAVRVYRGALSPVKAALLGPSARCRFTPSCSQYGLEAIQHHGAVSGSWLAVKRVCRCHPWGDCGHDPVPERAPKVGDASFRVHAVAVRRNDPNTPASARPAIKPAKLS